MKTNKETFNQKTTEWLKAQKSSWSKLRYELANINLKKYIVGKDLYILDLGGGNGLDSLPFAKEGNKVVLFDYSEEMLKAAKDTAKAEDISNNYEFINDDVSNLKNHFKEPVFNVILLHNVLSYVENPGEILKQVINSLKEGGLLSLMQVNKYSEVYQPTVFENNLDLALEKLDVKETKANLFDVPLTRFSAEELIELCELVGFKLIERFGISALNTFISNNEIKNNPEFYEKLKNLEVLMSTRFPYYHVARFNHLIFKKSQAV